MQRLAGRHWTLLQHKLNVFVLKDQAVARVVLDAKSIAMKRLTEWAAEGDAGKRIRIHGDFHLGQVLKTADDFVIVDFEGEPMRPLDERRQKSSPLRDAAGMIRSFDYAVQSVIAERQTVKVSRADQKLLSFWAECWSTWTAARFLQAYFNAIDASAMSKILPGSLEGRGRLLDALLLEKAIYELGYELNNRPGWVGIPLRGILRILKTTGRVPS